MLVRLPSAKGAPLASPDLPSDIDRATQNYAEGLARFLGTAPSAHVVQAYREGIVAERRPPGDSGSEPMPGTEIAAWKVEGLTFDAAAAARLLLDLTDEAIPENLAVGEDLRYWIVVSRFGLELVSRQRSVPTIEQHGTQYLARWRPVFDDEADAQRLRLLAESMPPACRALAWEADAIPPRGRDLIVDYVDAIVDGLARQASMSIGRGKPASRIKQPRSLGEEWLDALAGDPALKGNPNDLAAFYRVYRAWAQPVAGPNVGADGFRVCFRLEPPPAERDAGVVVPRGGARTWALQYLLQATDDPSLLVSAGDAWRHRGATVRFLNRRFDHPQERLLGGLGQAARLFAPVESSLRQARPEMCALTTGEAYAFIREKALLLRAAGFGVLVPRLEAGLGVRLRLGRKGSGPGGGPAAFSWSTLVDYDWQLALGGEPLSREEFEALARLKEPLVQIRGQWVELRPEQLDQALAFFERRAAGGQMGLPDALRLALAPDGDQGLPIVEVATEGWVDDLIRQLRSDGRDAATDEPPGFVGQLRGYQKTGVSWLATLRRYGLGACLADDMGLGKTVELIALLLQRQDAGPTLLVCPTSVVGNWRRELERFAPSLRVLVHHGAGRRKEEFAAEAAGHDVVISTYALLPRDEAELGGVQWGGVVLDEAQNVKNPSTKAAQAARNLPASWRAALTGTPVENRLTDLWSIFQFLNPGYLGSADEFRRRFANPIERAGDAAARARLKALVAPFILRRLKTDRTIIADLPEKNEMKVYCTLTREQATLYQAVVQDSLRQIEEAEGIQRRGLILATLTKLKQVCNHPALFLHDQSPLPDRSGKLTRLVEMLEEATSVGDRALVFTQYAEMGKLLKEYLASALGRDVIFLHGGTPAAERDRLVTLFQSEGRAPQVFVLSIKAGGTGLNLTRANHVFHFDRWWNPAVENQATDRAFRIGQRRDVQVHKFICAGTFEESLDQMIERKVDLAEAIVGAGESWITELTAEQLRDLFALRRDAVAEE